MKKNKKVQTKETTLGCSEYPHKNYKELKKQINLAFKELRKNGFIAKQDWACCNSCGMKDIYDEVNEEYIDAGKPEPDGFVFYHCQNTDLLKGYAETYLAWGAIDCEMSKKEEIKIGKTIVNILNKFDINVEWNGRIDTKIFISSSKNLSRHLS